MLCGKKKHFKYTKVIVGTNVFKPIGEKTLLDKWSVVLKFNFYLTIGFIAFDKSFSY